MLGAIAAQICRQVNGWLLIKLLLQGWSSFLAIGALALLLSLLLLNALQSADYLHNVNLHIINVAKGVPALVWLTMGVLELLCAGKHVKSCARLLYMVAACLMLERCANMCEDMNLNFPWTFRLVCRFEVLHYQCLCDCKVYFGCAGSTQVLAASLANLIIIVTNFAVRLQGLPPYKQTYRQE